MYRPEFNPAEEIWEHLRENYYGKSIRTNLEEIDDILCHGLKRLIANPDLVKSMAINDKI